MTEFLSDDSILMHKEYVRISRLKYSIIEEDIPQIKGKSIKEINRLNLSSTDRECINKLLPEILLHELYFTSFSHVKYQTMGCISKKYRNTADILNSIYKSAIGTDHGFVALCCIKADLEIICGSNYMDFFTSGEPVISVDVCEHAYFSDYGFDKERYLINALPYLNMEKVDKILKNG